VLNINTCKNKIVCSCGTYINLYKSPKIGKNMKQTIERYLDGSSDAKNYLLEKIERLHNYSISNHEALVLLYKRYGKPII